MTKQVLGRFFSVLLTIVFLGLFLALTIALWSYNMQDPAWTHNINSPIQNQLGSLGAWYADLSLSFLGKVSWLLPLALLGFSVLIWIEKGIDKEVFSWRLLMLFTATLSGCVLWAKHDVTQVHQLSQSAGGILGDWLSFNLEKAILSIPILMGFSLFIFVASITLLFGISWIGIMDSIGRIIIKFFTLLFNLAKPDKSQAKNFSEKEDKKEPQLESLIAQPEEDQETIVKEKLQKKSMERKLSPKDLGIEIVSRKKPNKAEETKDFSEQIQNLEEIYPVEKQAAPIFKPVSKAPVELFKEDNNAEMEELGEMEKILDGDFDINKHQNMSERKAKKIKAKKVQQLAKSRQKDAIIDINAFIKRPKKSVTKNREELSVNTIKKSTQEQIKPLEIELDLGKEKPQEPKTLKTRLEETSLVEEVFEKTDITNSLPDSFVDETKQEEPSFDIPSTDKLPEITFDHEESAPVKAAPITVEKNFHDAIVKSEQRAKISTDVSTGELNQITNSTESYQIPSLQLLDEVPEKAESYSEDTLAEMAGTIETTLAQFNLKATVMRICPGPVITRFELDLAPGIQAKKITALSQDLARALAVSRVRTEEVIPGSSYVGLEVPNKNRQTVYLSEVLNSDVFNKSKSPLTLSLGADTSDNPVTADLMKMPHALVAGTTGSGKSVCINVMLLSMLFKAAPKDLRLILIDPKMLEMSMYEDIPHLLTPVITDMSEAENALTWAVAEMERRYQLMAALKVRKIDAFNDLVTQAQAQGEPIKDPLWQPNESVGYTKHPDLEKLPFIVIVIDELADMMMVVGKQVEQLIARLTQKARAAGIHVILATQRPSTDVLTGLIKANVPTRIAFQVSSNTDSRVIIDGVGAEKLLGHGDMLYVPPGASHPQRLHGAFVSDEETDRVTSYIRSMGEPNYINGITNKQDPENLGAFGAAEAKEKEESDDPLYEEAIEMVLTSGKASISSVQRQLRIGYNRAARMIEEMQAQGIVSEPINGIRKVLGRR